MINQTTYVLVNCSRIFEGALRNALPAIAQIVSAKKETIKNSSFCGTIPSREGADRNDAKNPDSSNEDVINAAKNRVASMLSAPEAVMPILNERENRNPNTEPAFSLKPDCILYQVDNNNVDDAEMIGMIRRKCAFRDIPILLVISYKDLPKAQKLLAMGADKTLLFPDQPDNIVKMLNEALKPAGSQMQFDAKIINPYINAVVDLLEKMAHVHAEKKEVFLKKNYRLFGDVSAIMPFTGNVEGEVVVCFQEKLARNIVSSIMVVPSEDLSKEELRQGVGEIVNIVAGNAKAALSKTEYTHEITLPTVVFGQNHEISHPKNAPCIVVIFEVVAQPMAVLISMAVK